MKTTDELIKSIIVNAANFEHIAKTGNINGTLYTELKRIIEELRNSDDKEGDIIYCNKCGQIIRKPENGKATDTLS